MIEIKAGDKVLAVEYSEATHAPIADGKKLPAEVVGTEGIYFQVRYDDPGVFGGKTDIFYQSSRWRAWDGRRRWRLVPADEMA